MMLFSLLSETFPDGVYKIISSNVEGDQVTIVYSFVGTKLFVQSIDSLYEHCRLQAAKESVDIETYSRSEDYSCDVDRIQISKTKTEIVDLNRQMSPPSSSESSQKGLPATLPLHSSPYQILHNKLTHLLPHAGRLGSDTLKEGPTKQKRSMEMHFNGDDQIVKIIFEDLNTGP